jgi:VWFA-related protein
MEGRGRFSIKQLSAVAIGVFISIGILTLPAATRIRQEQIPLKYEVKVTLKLIQVYVADKKGNPVKGLKKEDFIVTDNGAAKSITEFEQHTLSGLAPEARPQPKETATLAATSLPAESMGRKFFLFFDFAYNNQRGIRKAKEAALHFFDTGLIPTDQVGVLSYSALKGLRVNEFLSSDHKKIRKTVEAIDIRDIVGLASDFEEETLQAIDRANPGKDAWGASWMSTEGVRQDSKNLALNFIERLTALGKALGFIPGQKQIILFSSGIPTSLMQGFNVISSRTTAMGDPVLLKANANMHKAMSSANCAVFAFNTRYDELNASAQNDATMTEVPKPYKPIVLTGVGTLREISKATGGKFFGNINEYKEDFNELQNLTGTYYVLGYYINEQWDGQYHKINVEVKKKGYDVHAQTGYFNPKPFREYTELEKKLHLYDLALSERPMFQTPLAFSLRTLVFADKDESRLLMLSKIPAEAIDGFSGKKVELVSLVFDEEENLAGLQRQETELTKYRGTDVFTSSEIALKSGTYRCRLVIRDLDTGTAAVAYGRASIPAKSAKALSLYSPFLLIQGSNFTYLEGVAKKKDTAIWKSIYPYDRARYSPLMGGLARGTSQFYAVAPCLIAGIGKPNITYTAALINKALGEKTFLPVSTMEKSRRGNVEISFLELSLNSAAPGEYIFYIFAEDTAARASSYAQTILIIE